jgi:quercetin dioxygenase-like cupin family protein
MKILRPPERPSRMAPAENFTGTVLQDPLIRAEAPGRVQANLVTFLPGARTNWHAHPLGQILYVLSGTGAVQTWGGPRRRVQAGDVVWFPAGEKHWHGAGPTTSMVHLALTEFLDGKGADWFEPVDDRDYQEGAAEE